MSLSIPFDEFTRSLVRELSAKKFRPIDSMIYLTYRCTSRCKTCNIWKRNAHESKDTELGWDKWEIILGRLKAGGIKSLEIFGGDALLRKDLIYDVISYCTDNGIETFFPTNSLLLDRESARRLVDSGLGTIYFSLDDVDAGNDEIRGQDGSFNLVSKAIENLCSERGQGKTPNIVICTTISNLNYNHFENVVDFLRKYPVDAVYPRVVCEFTKENIESSVIDGVKPEPYFTTTEELSHLLTEEQLKIFMDSVRRAKYRDTDKPIYINTGAIDSAGGDAFTKGEHPERRCLICSTFVTVDPLGNITPCPMYNKYTIGNLLESSLDEIWGNIRHRRFVRSQKKRGLDICKNCVMRGYYPTFSETCAHYLKKTLRKIAS
ncbi:MAG: radical SAM/SPASM domain-containing protein [Thermodesulfobacteriota bacterium]